MKHSSSTGAMSPSLPDMDKLKTQAESVHGAIKGTAIVSILDGDLVVWRQDPDDKSQLVVVNRKDLRLEGNEVRGVTMVVYPPEDRIENKLTILQESVGAGFVRLEQKLDGNEEEVAEEADTSEAQEALEEKADEEVLETVQAEESFPLSVEADASVGEDEELETTRSSLANWVETVILNNNSTSGE